ncbi:MAG: hypothetical protein QF845_02320 [Candidatus Marinimicrobia bacterium]|jgi:cytochrome c oxidase subunit 2|nr:hypothetical protein [Candidatus Neomarinimicrobiota bacterium]MDP6789349.1 hypothetical protein [Candidatus Neomarinimicrobiota bacterium]MDP7071741.1 hypothetical protein [Candidatus Neomarinimicrobiota bacterium]
MIEWLQALGLPIDASADGFAIDEILGLVHWLMLILFIGWGAFFIYSLIRFRQKRNPVADHDGVKSHFSSVLELAVAIIEMVLLVGFAIPIWASRVNDVPESSEAVHVRMVAQQFAWNIHYPGPDGIFGASSLELIDEEVNPIGLDRSSPGAADDIVTINQLHIPVNERIRIDLSSKDVIHSVNLPEFRVKQDAVPGMVIPMHFEASMTTEEFLETLKGTARDTLPDIEKGFQIACAQLCGLGHYRMKGYLTVHDEAGFQDWLADQAEYLEAEGDDDWDDDDW